MSDSSKTERGGDQEGKAGVTGSSPSTAPSSLFHTLPPAPQDPATTLRAPAIPGTSADAEIIIPSRIPIPHLPSPVAVTVNDAANTGAASDPSREELLAKLRERARGLDSAQIAALLKLDE